MIYRMKKGSPKGKIEKGEKNRKAAAREGKKNAMPINVDGKSHGYIREQTRHDKRHVGILWTLLMIRNRPAIVEDIKETRWMNGKEVITR
jgi:hypothetical protein